MQVTFEKKYPYTTDVNALVNHEKYYEKTNTSSVKGFTQLCCEITFHIVQHNLTT